MRIDRLVFSAPREQYLHVQRVPVDVTCPACGSGNVARYPIANCIGPRVVCKCQESFEVLDLDRPAPEDEWPAFRPVTLGWPASRAG